MKESGRRGNSRIISLTHIRLRLWKVNPKALHMEERLHERVIGRRSLRWFQMAVAGACGLQEPNGDCSCILLTNGVGKKELAALASFPV